MSSPRRLTAMTAALVVGAEVALLGAGAVLWLLAWRRGDVRRWQEAPDRLPPWTIPVSDFMLFMFLVIVLISVGPLVAVRLFAIDLSAPVTVRDTLIQGYGFQLSGLAACLIFRVHPAGSLPPSDSPVLPAVGTGLRSFLYLLPVITLIAAVCFLALQAMGMDPEEQDLIATFRQARNGFELVLLIGLATIIAPVTEELIFRAGLFRFFASRLSDRWAMGISSVLFALLHQNALTFVPFVALGCVLCALYQRTGRLAAPIVLHAVFNLNSVLVVLYGPES